MKSVAVSLLTLLTLTSHAASVTLAWDQSPPPVSHYNLYAGIASRSYTNIVSTTNTTLTLSGLTTNTTYYFAVTLVRNGLESQYSTEVFYTTTQTNGATSFPASTTVSYPPNIWAIGGTAAQLWPGGGFSAAPYYIPDGVFGSGDTDQILMVNIPGWCTNIAGTVTVQCASRQAWTNRAAAFYYTADPAIGRIVDNAGVFFTTVASNGLNAFSWSIPVTATNTLKEFQLWAMPSTNSAARYFVGPMTLTFN